MKIDYILKNRLFHFILFLALAITSSCIPFKKTILLKENKLDDKQDQNILVSHNYDDYKLQIDDFVSIKVYSPDEESVNIFDTGADNGNMRMMPGRINPQELRNAFQVEKDGTIMIPIVGSVDVEGLTISELKTKLQHVFDEYYKFVTIKVELVSFYVTIIGEIGSPGLVRVYTENTNFFQVISQAGGITHFANTKRVKIVRKITNTEVQVHYVDISKLEFISNKDYYLKPGDIVYIEPLKAKSQRDNLFLLGLITSLTGLTFSIIALLNR